MEKNPTKRTSVPLCKDPTASSLSHGEFCSTRNSFQSCFETQILGEISCLQELQEPLVMVIPQGMQWEPGQGPKEDIWI